jgi:hypothetical protein
VGGDKQIAAGPRHKITRDGRFNVDFGAHSDSDPGHFMESGVLGKPA